ncbi:MAG: peptide chain release factor 1 [Clostridia bacterium]|nr:peptide chain release factor 1 [Clostridia bacterium]
MRDKLIQIEQRFEEIEQNLGAEEILSAPDKLRQLMKERKLLEPVVEAFRAFSRTEKELLEAEELAADMQGEDDMRTLAEEEAKALRARLDDMQLELKRLLLPRDENDDKNVIMEIRAGAGGEEAALFAGDLFRMYSMYAAGEGWKLEPMSENATELGGYREISFMVVGEGAYSKLKYESGVHRVQRVPKTESQGRIQTSTVTVAVLPEVEDVEITINPADLEVETLKSSGAGGQHINKTESAIRIYHKPTGIIVFCQEERSQMKNRDKAMKMLRAKLYEIEQQKQNDSVTAARRSQVGTGDRSEKIRTYNFPQSRMTDHRIGLTLYQLDSIMNGSIGAIIEALATADTAEKMRAGEHEN